MIKEFDWFSKSTSGVLIPIRGQCARPSVACGETLGLFLEKPCGRGISYVVCIMVIKITIDT